MRPAYSRHEFTYKKTYRLPVGNPGLFSPDCFLIPMQS